MSTTKVKVKCVSKKEQEHYFPKTEGISDLQTVVELEVPYEPESDYHKLSGDTNFELKTVNQAAADMFAVGKYYDVLISPSED